MQDIWGELDFLAGAFADQSMVHYHMGIDEPAGCEWPETPDPTWFLEERSQRWVKPPLKPTSRGVDVHLGPLLPVTSSFRSSRARTGMWPPVLARVEAITGVFSLPATSETLFGFSALGAFGRR